MAAFEHQQTLEDAERALRGGDLDEAESICRGLLKKNKKDLGAIQLRGHVAARRRDFPEALKQYQKCTQVKPGQAHFQYLVGNLTVRRVLITGHFDDACRTAKCEFHEGCLSHASVANDYGMQAGTPREAL